MSNRLFVKSFALFTFSVLMMVTLNASMLGNVEAEDEPGMVVTLYAGQHIEAGHARIWNDADNLYISYETVDGWLLAETHLYAGKTDPAELTSSPGQFPYSAEHEPQASSYIYTIPLDSIDSYHLTKSKKWEADQDPGIEPGDVIFIAAHAVVTKDGSEETAWADGYQFPGNNWATYFDYTVQSTEPSTGPVLILPEEQVKMKIVRCPGSNGTYFDEYIWDIPEGYDMQDGLWPGWCVDSNVYIYLGVTYFVDLYNSYDPELPELVRDDEQWEYINYIINHKHPDATSKDILAAIWYFADETPNYWGFFTDLSQAMVDDALANGEGFVPTTGQILAIIVDAGPSVQVTFVEYTLGSSVPVTDVDSEETVSGETDISTDPVAPTDPELPQSGHTEYLDEEPSDSNPAESEDNRTRLLHVEGRDKRVQRGPQGLHPDGQSSKETVGCQQGEADLASRSVRDIIENNRAGAGAPMQSTPARTCQYARAAATSARTV
jgi:hypothetical protein